MRKVFLLTANEDWIVDRFVKEWSEDNSDITTADPRDADVIWLLASWCWRHVPHDVLSKKKVIATVHHIVPEKFDESKKKDFRERDQYVTEYHVYNKKTKDIVELHTKKPVILIPYWANQRLWTSTGDRIQLRRKYSLPVDSFLVGSFQRDTEGFDLRSPKLEKGPDLFADFVEKLFKEGKDYGDTKVNPREVHVVLAGWRRQYVISRLKEIGVSYTYFERPNQSVLKDLYQTLDLYPVTSRDEGGPQSLIECGLLKIPVVSRDVGIASQVLPEESINDDVYFSLPEIPRIDDRWLIPRGYESYRHLIEKI